MHSNHMKRIKNGILRRTCELTFSLMILLVFDALIESIIFKTITVIATITLITIAIWIIMHITIDTTKVMMMLMLQDPNHFDKIIHSSHASHHFNLILITIIFILGVLYIMDDCLSFIYINKKSTTMTPTLSSEIEFSDAVYGNPSLLLLLSLSTMAMFTKIAPMLVNSGILTLKVDKYKKTIIMNEFARNNDVVQNTKCEKRKQSETGQCVAVLGNFSLVLSTNYVLMDAARGNIISFAIAVAIHLFSSLINATRLLLAVLDEFNPIEYNPTMNYYVCVSIFCFVVVVISNINKITQTKKHMITNRISSNYDIF